MLISLLRQSTRVFSAHTASSIQTRGLVTSLCALKASNVNAMPSITLPRRRPSQMTTENAPIIEVHLPPPIEATKSRRKSAPQARNLEIKVEQLGEHKNHENASAPPPPIESLTSGHDTLPAEKPAPKRQRKTKKQIQDENASVLANGQVKEEAASLDASPPIRKRRRAAQKPAIVEDDQADMDDSKSAVATSEPASGAEDDSVELDSDGEPVRRGKNGRKIAKRKKKVKEPIVYVIPDVPSRDFRSEGPIELREERKDGFKGRLGYACLNTVLRNGDPPVFCSRNVRIKTIEEKGLDWVKELALQNVKDIIPLLEWNAKNNIHMMRLSSEIFPFAGHDKYGYDISYAAKELAEAGEVARRLNQRLTMHPGQFCVLSTPREAVLDASIRELAVHAKVLDLMGVGPDGVMILHGGGTYGDRDAALERIKHTINTRLPESVRRRLVLENDEMSYSAEELLQVCESVDPPVPLVFDFHHDLLRPSSIEPSEIIRRAEAIFAKRGITPKYHLSEPRPGARTLMERRAHSDRCVELPPDLPVRADLMLECKDKEQGVLEMYRIYNLFPVEHDNLRPPADDLTTSTGGRKSKLDGSGGAGAAIVAGQLTPGKQQEQNLIERAIEKAKAAAAKRGVKYTGPKSQKEREEARGPVLSAAEVREDMHKKAEWIRSELRQGRERRASPSFLGEDSASMKEEPEPDAY